MPPRHGLSAAWMRTPDRNGATTFAWATMRDWLRERIPAQVDVDAMLADARFVYGDGTALLAADPYVPQTFVWFHRDLRDEPEVPGAPALARFRHRVNLDKTEGRLRRLLGERRFAPVREVFAAELAS